MRYSTQVILEQNIVHLKTNVMDESNFVIEGAELSFFTLTQNPKHKTQNNLPKVELLFPCTLHLVPFSYFFNSKQFFSSFWRRNA